MVVLGFHDNGNKIIDRSCLIEWFLILPKGKTSKLQLFSQYIIRYFFSPAGDCSLPS